MVAHRVALARSVEVLRAATEASQALRELERRRASEGVPDAEAKKVERAFKAAKEAGEAPFAERLAG